MSFIPFTSSSGSYGVQPAPGGVAGWFNDRVRSFKNRNSRTAAGAYEGAGPAGRTAARQGFGPLDPDDAWDSRVGAEADAYYYNEEQELGLHGGPGGQPRSNINNGSRLNVSSTNTAYLGSGGLGGSTYDMNVPAASGSAGEELEDRGRTRGRSPHLSAKNPFDDDADPSNMSLRGVSPRPIVDTNVAGAGAASRGSKKPDSPTGRRSMFRENV